MSVSDSSALGATFTGGSGGFVLHQFAADGLLDTGLRVRCKVWPEASLPLASLPQCHRRALRTKLSSVALIQSDCHAV